MMSHSSCHSRVPARVGSQGECRMAMPSGKEKLRAALKERYPSEANGIDAYFSAVQAQQESAGLFFGGKVISGLLPKSIENWVTRLLSAGHRRLSDETVETMLDRITSNAEYAACCTSISLVHRTLASGPPLHTHNNCVTLRCPPLQAARTAHLPPR